MAAAAFLVAMLGPWLWFAAAFALLALAVAWPARIVLACGLGALLTGTAVVALQFTALAIPGAPAQALAFAALAALSWFAAGRAQAA